VFQGDRNTSMTRTKPTARPSMIAVFLFLVSVFLSSPAPAQTVDPHHRPFTIDDLFEIEGLGRYYGGPFSFSSDGNALAFVRVRPQRLTKDFSMDFLWGAERSDVWIQKRPQDPPIKLTNGEEDGTGWWVPQWSADGRYLAMLSTRGGNVTLWVEDFTTNQLHQLTQRGIDLGDIRRVPYMWLDSRHILTEVLPVGEQPESMKVDTETPEIATEGWKKQRGGKEVTASVLDSGVPINLAARPHGQLQRVDVTSGAVETVADENISAQSLSPDGKFVAYARQVSVYTPKADEPLPFGINDEKKYSLVIKSVAGTAVANGDQYSRDVMTSSLRWSPDSKQLAFLGYSDTREKTPRLYKIDVMDREVNEQDLGDLDPTPVIRQSPELEWTSNGGICLLAAKRVGGKKPGAEDRRDWWLIGRDGSERNLTEQATKVPPKLWPAEGRNTFVGLADGKLWRVTPATAQIVNATESVSVKIAAITWPLEDDPMGESQSSLSGREFSEIVFATGEGKNLSLSLLNLNSGAIRPLQKPVASASLNAFDSASGSIVFSSSDRSGTFVWRTSLREGAPVELVKANTFLTDIVDGKPQMIEYVSLDGEKLKAWLLLPYNYEQGHRYPTVTWVYVGSVAKDSPSVLDDITFFSPLNLQIFSSRGYAVLIPSMPLKPEGDVDDPMLRLMNGVIPAVDKGIDAGIIDPDRLFVMGQSFGGFSTYGLITQTNRFKAAVSLAGLSDLISLYGQFDARQRYGAYPHEDLFMEALTEGGQVLMGSPPWKDLGRYIRNSPIFFVDRVQTPILIIQGDLDYVAMQQGEEFFKSLYRQGKRARFVRYWGEDHVFTSPANVRDMWQQIFAWFDGFGGPTKSPSSTTRTGH
jgi:dipeptidyl aminopeptidase/acylaminoacyl peptidase